MATPADRLADTVIALLVEDGFEGVSVRRVASRAGVSIGAVQHHFPTKAAMLTAAMQRVSKEFEARIQNRLRTEKDPVVILRVLCDELLGVGAERRAASVIWLQRLARAAVDPQIAADHTTDWMTVEKLLTSVIAQCRPDRSAGWQQDQAASLVALLDGLAAAVLTEPERMPAERADRLVAERLQQLLGR
jgi:AcrR family transcriptional regulator